jgi:uncharacterized protein (DUF433 family)
MPTYTVTVPSHIWLDESNRAWIDDKNIKVIEVVMAMKGNGWTAEDYYQGLGHYLTLAQIYAALAYYHDHQAEFDAEIERQQQEDLAAWKAQGTDTPLHRRLRAAGLIP